MKVEKSSPFADASDDSPAHHAMIDVGKNRAAYGLPENPNALVVISAHWEDDGFHVYSPENPRLMYDYHGFPEHTYKLKYEAPTSPLLARRIVEMINADKEIKEKAVLDEKRRGFDHVFLPLMLLFPEAKYPIVQISLSSRLDLDDHIRLGKILAPFRAENVLIIGSGSATHPMRPGGSPAKTEKFMSLMNSVITNPSLSPEEHLKALPNIWNSELMSSAHIPTSEHLTPLAVSLGAGNGSIGTDLFKIGKDFRFANGLFSMACYIFHAQDEKCSI